MRLKERSLVIGKKVWGNHIEWMHGCMIVCLHGYMDAGGMGRWGDGEEGTWMQ
jgi:hypothetical protein